MASPFVMEGISDNVKELLEPATKGTTGILEAIYNNNPSVKRVVITSSFASIWNGSKGTWPEHTYTEADWNPVTWEEAANPETNGAIAYCASKTFAERAAWDFIKEKKPEFSLVTVCPPMVYGPAAHEPANVKELNTSSAEIYRLCNGSMTEVPETGFYAFCDVRDVAEAHVKAYETANPGRFFVTGGNYTFQQVCDIIRKDFPERRHLTPEGTVGQELPKVYKVDNGKARRELGMTFRDLQTTIHDMVVEFQNIEQRSGMQVIP
jgi:nucleoside-diphosphate-sugar epimerase